MDDNELARRGTDAATAGASARRQVPATMDRPPHVRWTPGGDGRVIAAQTPARPAAAGTGPVPGSSARLSPTPEPFAATATNGFVAAGELFDLEYAGPFIRIWCRACDKFEHLTDDGLGTVDAAQAAHRCGARTSDWDRGDLGVRV